MARRATYVVDGRFFGHFFWKVGRAVCIHVSHVQLMYTVINMQGAGGGFRTSENSESLENLNFF